MKKRASSAVAIAAATALWLTLDQTTQPSGVAPATDQAIRQTYLIDVSHWRFDATGSRRDTLVVADAVRMSDQPQTHMQRIRFSGRDRSGQPWVVNAGSGVWHQPRERLSLGNEVVVHATQGTLMTSELLVNLTAQTASTPAEVSLSTPTSQTTARGLNLDLESGRLALLSDVETRYAPTAVY